MSLFEREADKNIKRMIADDSYIDLSVIGPQLAKFITIVTGEKYVFQPDAVMYAVHRIKVGKKTRDEHIAMHYILLIKESAKQDKYIRDYNKDLSDIEERNDGIILYQSNKVRNQNYGEQIFTYPNDKNGNPVTQKTRKFPFYYIDREGELQQSYDNLGLMYSIIDEIIEKRVELEMTEVDDSIYEAVKQFVKTKRPSQNKSESE